MSPDLLACRWTLPLVLTRSGDLFGHRRDLAALLTVYGVRATAGRTSSGAVIHRQFYPTVAHPADAPSGNTGHERVRQDVPNHGCPGGDESVVTDGDTAHDGGIRAHSGPALDQCALVFGATHHMAARIGDVGEHHRRSAKDVIFQDYSGINGNIVLNFYVVADLDAR